RRSLFTSLFPYTTLFRSVSAVAIESTGDLYVGGAFFQFDNQARPYLVHLYSDGTFDSSFSVSVDGRVQALAFDRNSQLLLAGDRSEEHTSELQSLAYLVC